MPKLSFSWNPAAGATGRYRDQGTGRFVSGSAVRKELDVFIANAESAPRAASELLRSGEISLDDWALQMRQSIKETHLASIAEARGGWENMTQSDYGRAGQIIREQYGYLEEFKEQIASGDQALNGNIDRRAEQYVKAGRESFYKAKQAEAKKRGISHVRSLRFPGDSCTECVELDRVWFGIGDPKYKLPGDRICRKNCRCGEEYGVMEEDGTIVVMGQ